MHTCICKNILMQPASLLSVVCVRVQDRNLLE